MFLRIHLVKCIHRMHAEAGSRTPKIELSTNKTVLLQEFTTKNATNLPVSSKVSQMFLAAWMPDIFAHSFS